MGNFIRPEARSNDYDHEEVSIKTGTSILDVSLSVLIFAVVLGGGLSRLPLAREAAQPLREGIDKGALQSQPYRAKYPVARGLTPIPPVEVCNAKCGKNTQAYKLYKARHQE